MDTSRVEAQSLRERLTVELRSAEGATVPVQVDLSYDSWDPFALTITFLLGEGPVQRTFARDLLTGGLVQPTGDGDVHVWPCLNDHGEAIVTIELCSPDGNALVEMRLSDAVRFVDRTHALVALGRESEHLDLDATILALTSVENL